MGVVMDESIGYLFDYLKGEKPFDVSVCVKRSESAELHSVKNCYFS